MATALHSPKVNLNETLDALRSTPKGRLKYEQYRVTPEKETWIGDTNSFAVTGYKESSSCGNGIGAASFWSTTNRAPLTINTLYSDDEDEETAYSSRPYYLDEDNTLLNATSVISNVSDVDTKNLKPERQLKVPTLLSCVSAEEVALKELSLQFDREMQINTLRKQEAYIERLNALESDFMSRKEEIELMESFRLSSMEQEWDNEQMKSKMRYKKELDKLNKASRKDQQALNAELDKLNADNQKEMEMRIKEKLAAKEREQAALKRIREKCGVVLSDIRNAEDKLNGLLNSDVFTLRPVTKPFIDSGKAAAAKIHDSVNQLSTKTSARTIKDLEDCLQSLHIVTERVLEQYQKSEELNRNQEAERHRLALQRQRSQQQALERQRSQQHALERQQSQQQERQRSQQQTQESQQPVQQTDADQSVQQSSQHLPPGLLSVSCSETSKQEYQRLYNLVENAKGASKALAANPEGKKLRLELQKAVSITVNAISALSGAHIKEKYQTLSKLIRGGNVSVGDSLVSTQGNQAAMVFCKSLAARKLVEQADSQVSSNPKTAFPFAAVMVSLMNESADMRDLILGYFYIQCPYLIPHYPERAQGQSIVDYFSVLGYKVNASGDVEAQDLFIKRVAGFTKLYASCLCSRAVGGHDNQSLDMSNAWTYLAKLLNTMPRVATTATVLASFLSVCGSKLVQTYGRQAKKLLRFMLLQYLPAIKNATDANDVSDGGSTERLEQCLMDLVNGRSLRDPEGYLSERFWRSYGY